MLCSACDQFTESELRSRRPLRVVNVYSRTNGGLRSLPRAGGGVPINPWHGDEIALHVFFSGVAAFFLGGAHLASAKVGRYGWHTSPSCVHFVTQTGKFKALLVSPAHPASLAWTPMDGNAARKSFEKGWDLKFWLPRVVRGLIGVCFGTMVGGAGIPRFCRRGPGSVSGS